MGRPVQELGCSPNEETKTYRRASQVMLVRQATPRGKATSSPDFQYDPLLTANLAHPLPDQPGATL